MERKKKVAGNPTRTVDSVKDKRFAHILKNPVYRPVPKKEKKVEIDKRFQAMFEDKRFKLHYKVDKRGRPVETTTDENLKRYYNLADEDGNDDEEDDGESALTNKALRKGDNISGKKQKDFGDGDSSEDESEDSSEDDEKEADIDGNVKEEEIKSPLKIKGKKKLDETTKKKLHSSEIDYARGEANFVDESSSDDESSTDEDDNEISTVHDWGELDKDAPRTEDSTRRLALCNMDWDRVRAIDLMVLLGSFLPPGGVIRSVTIYPSEFGKERMAEEETHGPRELRENDGDGLRVKKEPTSDSEEDQEHDISDDDEEGEGSQYSREKLRQYQLNRLKYYYAIAEFDSAQTAEKVYSECDGMEYESSAAKVDLRFVPDDVDFDDDKPKDQCTELPDSTKYRPRFFTTTALQQVKVDLTWDETDPFRKELTEKIFDPKEKVDDDDIRAYLATSSESENEEEPLEADSVIKEEEDATTNTSKEVTTAAIGEKKKKSKQDTISKYKALLQSIESTEKKKKEKDMEMEITWGVGLKESTEKLVKKKLEEEQKSKRTPWEEMLDKRKEKRQARKHERKRKAEGTKSDEESGSENEEGKMFSDDDVDVDMSDEFFQSELRENDIFKHDNKAKKKNNKTNDKKDAPEKQDGSEGKTAAELELLLMDEDDNKRHFSLKKIIKEENDTKSKKKRRNKKKRPKLLENSKAPIDEFEIDVADSRFGALFNSHHFNIDPSDPNYKKTKAMERIISEKHRRRAAVTEEEVSLRGADKEHENGDNNTDSNRKEQIRKKAELSYLVKSIKRNTESLKSKKKF